jgi:hypothetical protein
MILESLKPWDQMIYERADIDPYLTQTSGCGRPSAGPPFNGMRSEWASERGSCRSGAIRVRVSAFARWTGTTPLPIRPDADTTGGQIATSRAFRQPTPRTLATLNMTVGHSSTLKGLAMWCRTCSAAWWLPPCPIITVSTRSASTCSNLTGCRRRSGSPPGRPRQSSTTPARYTETAPTSTRPFAEASTSLARLKARKQL